MLCVYVNYVRKSENFSNEVFLKNENDKQLCIYHVM